METMDHNDSEGTRYVYFLLCYGYWIPALVPFSVFANDEKRNFAKVSRRLFAAAA